MYTPKTFKIENLTEIHSFIEKNNFGILVDSELVGTHLPFLLKPNEGTQGVLYAHMARANPQWKQLDQKEVLVIFAGPHTYITPSWYNNHPSVPTWNYTAVHAYGRGEIISDEVDVYNHLKEIVETHEAGYESPWEMDLPEDYIEKQIKALVTFKLEVTRFEAKYKLSQNKTQEDHDRVRDELLASSNTTDQQVGEYMSKS